ELQVPVDKPLSESQMLECRLLFGADSWAMAVRTISSPPLIVMWPFLCTCDAVTCVDQEDICVPPNIILSGLDKDGSPKGTLSSLRIGLSLSRHWRRIQLCGPFPPLGFILEPPPISPDSAPEEMVPCSCPSSVLCLLPSLLLLLQLPPGGFQAQLSSHTTPFWTFPTKDMCIVTFLTPMSVFTERFHVFGPSFPIVAELGKDTTLPCSLYPVMSAENMELRWFWSNTLESERHEKLMAQYAGRTSLVRGFLSEGKAAVRIHKLQTADNGLYTCSFSNGVFYEEAIYGATSGRDGVFSIFPRLASPGGVGSAPQVHITGPQEDGVRVVCTASGWFPEPQVQWRDPSGEQFLEFSKVQAQDTEGLFSVEAALVVRDSSVGSVTCSIINPILGQQKAMAIVIPEPFFPWASPWKPAFLVSLPLLLLLLLGAACYTWREHTQMRELKEERILFRTKEYLHLKKEALKDTVKAGHGPEEVSLPGWKAQLYADWRKEQFRAWPVTLDPISSTSSGIVLSHDRKSLICDDFVIQRSILGLEGIRSGRCYWEIEVRNADRTTWGVGVWRKDEKTRYKYPSPSDGSWVVGKDFIFQAFTRPHTPLHLRQVPQRVGVFLDYDHGDVSFYNMIDGSHIFSFPPESFSGTLLPFFICFSEFVSLTLCTLEAGPEKPSVPRNNPLSLEEPVGPSGEGIASDSGMDGAPPGPEAPLLP
ncbi:Butyrophilin subfamily 3 member A3, partial [Galemys pyrenaicus]